MDTQCFLWVSFSVKNIIQNVVLIEYVSDDVKVHFFLSFGNGRLRCRTCNINNNVGKCRYWVHNYDKEIHVYLFFIKRSKNETKGDARKTTTLCRVGISVTWI